MPVERFSADHPLWDSYLTHLDRVDMARWVVDMDGCAKPDIICLGAIVEDSVAGHITLRVQDMRVPVPGRDDAQTTIPGADGLPLRETFINTFAVDVEYRRQGHGRALQTAAIALTKALGCYQIRSWTPFETPVNYATMIALGYAVHPALTTTEHGRTLGGVYFIQTV
ncbi:MAG TPA: GNAT family N-acetyltransferase [Aggregatilinea sp.]|jgi:GNAT superfamily N-acetyltransferase|uniref:GNAT family N-acetyltransferase n=1 Tax=Aggregatilinea sp. TaxID=2806333 RepID=UPI002C0FCAAB|nr:GNAT family N-acetyltransferase [Aggregatilinea sp.]HML24939.1 GNAT family N-acetyltransferase [Aggregatilinea sp.]